MPRSATGASPQSAYQRALGRLARRDHSVAELRRALAARGHEADEVEAALERLRRDGVPLHDIELHTPDLEEVFLHLTGKAS